MLFAVLFLSIVLLFGGCLGEPWLNLYFEPSELHIHDIDQEYTVQLMIDSGGIGTIYVENIEFYMELHPDLGEDAQNDLVTFIQNIGIDESDDIIFIHEPDSEPVKIGYRVIVKEAIPVGFLFDLIADIIGEDLSENGLLELTFSLREWQEQLSPEEYYSILTTLFLVQTLSDADAVEFFLDITYGEPDASLRTLSRDSALKVIFDDGLK